MRSAGYLVTLAFVLCLGLGGCESSGKQGFWKSQNELKKAGALEVTRKKGVWVHEGLGYGSLQQYRWYWNRDVCQVVIIVSGPLNEVDKEFLESRTKEDWFCLETMQLR